MQVLDVISAPWAIVPSKLEEIQAIYASHVRGERADLEAIEARIGRPLQNEHKAYEVVDGVAVLPLEGVIAKRMNLMMAISGGTSSELAVRDLRNALADSSVHSVILAIDSPGGTVDGTPHLANAIRAARDVKPIVTLGGGTMASAAYWAGAAARQVFIAEDVTQVGSIGVVAKHVDISGAEAAKGIKTTEVFAGQYKRIASQYGPLTEAGRQSIQDQLDYTYSLFVASVAASRGVSEDKVLKDMADGRVFMGQQAVTAGLVDGITTLDALVAQLNQERGAASRTVFLPPPKPTPSKGKAMSLTREQLATDHPALLQAVLDEGRAAGATAERERIQAVEAACMPGHESLIASMKFDGKSTGGDAALAVIGAENQLRVSQAAALKKSAPDPLPNTSAATVDKTAGDDKPTPATAAASMVALFNKANGVRNA